jgi:hypothetical protein
VRRHVLRIRGSRPCYFSLIIYIYINEVVLDHFPPIIKEVLLDLASTNDVNLRLVRLIYPLPMGMEEVTKILTLY